MIDLNEEDAINEEETPTDWLKVQEGRGDTPKVLRCHTYLAGLLILQSCNVRSNRYIKATLETLKTSSGL